MLPTIAEHAKLHGIKPVKKLGQNFIFDSSICDKIVKYAAVNKDSSFVLEIGSGPGGLTRSILNAKPNYLLCVEMDKRCLKILDDLKKIYNNLEYLNIDALNISLKYVADKFLNNTKKTKIDIVANLPYNIATELIYKWIDDIEIINSISVMIQKEVADRITASPNCKSYGKLSVICQSLFNCKKLFDVPPHIFYPPPKVWSSVISMKPKTFILSNRKIQKLNQILSAAFSMRRKMVKSSLKNEINILNFLSIDTSLRAENLSVSDFVNITNKFFDS